MMADQSQRTVLIVDDSPGVRLAMEKLLSPYVNVQVADGAGSALQALSAETALVLADIRMPGVDGLQLARSLRQSHPHLPVVLMTGIADDALRAQARELGVKDVLRKPLRPDVLLPTLQEWMDGGLPQVSPAPPTALATSQMTQAQDTQPHALAPAPAPSGRPEVLPISAASTYDVTPYLTGLRALPGVMTVWVFGAQGQPLTTQTQVPAEVGAYVKFLVGTAGSLANHLNTEAAIRALQVEFLDRVLVIAPIQQGFLVAQVRDTPAASSVKGWIRTHVTGEQQKNLH